MHIMYTLYCILYVHKYLEFKQSHFFIFKDYKHFPHFPHINTIHNRNIDKKGSLISIKYENHVVKFIIGANFETMDYRFEIIE